MKTLRRWELGAGDPYTLNIAADARLSRTSYTDDQVWQARLGNGDAPAIAIQTMYGGRVGLASLVPMWTLDGHIIYQSQTYHQPPAITAFTPGFMRIEGDILAGLSMNLDIWTADSQTLCGIILLDNQGDTHLSLRAEIFAHVGLRGKEEPIGIIAQSGGGNALALITKGPLQPVVVMEGAAVAEDHAGSSRIGVDVKLAPGSAHSIRFVHSGLNDERRSLKAAREWMKLDWNEHMAAIEQAARAIPEIRTGNTDWDSVIASSYNRLVQSYLRPAGSFPRPFHVAMRQPDHGFSVQGDGSDYPRAWAGIDPHLNTVTAPAIAGIDPELAEGPLRNFIAIQQRDGWIDMKPGPAGQRRELLCPPLLARSAWTIYQQTGNMDFISDVFPGLLNFFERWQMNDLDADGDDIPEWQDERQMGYVAFPTFGAGQPWAQGADVRTVESPDLLAYLISEGNSLRQMAELLDKKSVIRSLDEALDKLKAALDSLWDGQRYTYRDRDTHISSGGAELLHEAPGDVAHEIDHALLRPNRLIIRVKGGVSHIPRIALTVEGLDTDSKPLSETLETERFRWQNRQGIATTEQVFSHVQRISCKGLSRVYRLSVHSLDTNMLDINTFVPLWAMELDTKRSSTLTNLLLDKQAFRQPNGLSVVPASDPHYDPSSASGGGGIWPYWQTIMGEALIAAGEGSRAADLVKDYLKMQTEILREDPGFGQYYHAETPKALGERDHLMGIAPLHLLNLLTGIRIVSSGAVWTGGPFEWGRSISIRQHGVRVRRTSKGTKVDFPSGHSVELPPDAPWQAVIDPDPKQFAPIRPAMPSIISEDEPQATNSNNRVIIEVEHDD